MKVGFTGTRKGLTPEQNKALADMFCELEPAEFLQGCCLGADEEATELIYLLFDEDVRISGFPGHPTRHPEDKTTQSLRAITLSREVWPSQTHFRRNRQIVDRCDILVACPGKMHEETTGGTWYTIRHAVKTRKSIIIVWPDGKVERSK